MRTAWSLPGLLALLVAALACAAPALGSLAGQDLLAGADPRLPAWCAGRAVRLATGWGAVAIVGFQFLHSARMRTSLTFGVPYPLWIALHQGSGILFLALVALHTAGRWGVHLNGWLSLAVFGAVFGGILGKLAEFLLMTRIILGRLAAIPDRRRNAPPDRRVRARPGRERRVAPGDSPVPALYRFRTAWSTMHLTIAALLAVTLAFHVAAVGYF